MGNPDEDAIKKRLGIASWRNLSKDTVMSFASALPEMDKDLAMKIVDQIPAIKDLAIGTLDKLKEQHLATLNGNAESVTRVHSAYENVQAALADRMKRDDLSQEDLRYVTEQMFTAAEKQDAKDTENKRFLSNLFDKAAVVTLAVVAIGLAYVGGKGAFSKSA